MTEAAGPAHRVRKRVNGLDFGPCHGLEHELGDTLASFLIGLAWGGIITLVTIPVSRLLAARKHRRA